MKLTWDVIRQKVRLVTSPKEAKTLPPDAVKEMARQIARGVATTRPDELSCGECFEQLDRFVDMKLAGKNAAEAMPLVQDHLDRCGDCREEFEALLSALQALS
jgi:hypothetical protein